jgi:hypothetical protein
MVILPLLEMMESLTLYGKEKESGATRSLSLKKNKKNF